MLCNLRFPSAFTDQRPPGKLAAGLFLLAAAFLIPSSFAAVGVTGPTASLTADTAANGNAPAWTSLAPITITEGAATDFATGITKTLILAPPTGFQFNAAQTPSVSVPAGGSDLSALSASVAAGSLTITFTVGGTARIDQLTIGATTALQVQPTKAGPLAVTGSIVRPAGGSGGTATIAGLTAGGGVSCGQLSEVVGTFTKLQLLMPGETASAGTASGKTGAPTAQTAGTAFNVIINAVDAYWNIVSMNDSVQLTCTDANATGVPVTTSLLNGTETVSVTCLTAASQNLTASDLTNPGITSNTGASATVKADVLNKLQVLMPGETSAPGTAAGKTGTPAAQTAGASFNVKVNSVDAYWNIVSTTDSVMLICTDPNATGVPATAALSGGSRTFNVLGKTAGTQTFTASDQTFAGVTANTGTSTIVNTGPSTKLQLLMPGETPSPGTATGKTGTPAAQTAGTSFTVTVNAVDANWNVVSTNDLIKILSSDANAVLPANAILSAGTGTFTVTPRTAGSKTVTAADVANPGITSNTGATTTINPAAFASLQVILPGESAAPGTATGKTGNPTARTAGAVFGVTVNGVDPFWNVVNTTDTVMLTSSDPSATLPAGTALVAGTTVCSVTFKTEGVQTVTATNVTNGTITSNTGTGAAVNPAAANKLAIGVQPSATATAGAVFGQQPVVWIEDTYGNILSNSTVTIAAVRSGGVGTLQGTTAMAAVGGVATFANLSHLIANSITIQFSSPGLTTVTSAPIAVSAAAFSQLQVLMPGESNSPGSVSGKTGSAAAQTAGAGFTVTVNGVDAYWNVANGNDSVKIICSDANATGVPATSALLGGTTTYSVTCYTAGNQTVTASDLTNAGITSNAGTAAINAGALAQLQILMPGETAAPGTPTGKTGAPTAQTNGTAFNVTVKSVDANWNLVGTTDSVKLVCTDPNATGVPATANLAAGAKTFNVICKTAGTQTFTATNLTHTSVGPASGAATTVNPGAFTKLQLLMPGETAAAGTAGGKTGTPAAQTAGTFFSVIVNAVDANWNVIGTNDLIAILSSDANAVLPAGAALISGSGTFAVTLRTAGSKTVTATDLANSGITANASPSTTVNVGALKSLQVIMPGETAAPGSATGKTGATSSKSAGTAFNVTINAVDSCWNVVSVTDSVNLTCTDAAATGVPATSSLANGTKTVSVTCTTAGSQSLTASDLTNPGITSCTGAPITITAAAANKLAIATQPSSSAAAGVTFAQQPVVWIEDIYGNICGNSTVSVTATRLGGSGTLQGTTSLSAVNGVASFSNLSHLVATTITIQFASTGLTSVTSGNVAVSTAPFSQLVVIMPGESLSPGSLTGRSGTPTAQTAGTSFNVTVKSVDAYWNLVNASDNVAITATDANAILPATAALIVGTRTFAVTIKAGPSQSVIAADITLPAITANTGTSTTINPAAPAKLQVLMPGETVAAGTVSGKAGTPATQTAGNPFNVTVNAVDTYWNVVNTSDSVKIICSDPNAAGAPATNSLVSGTTTFSVICKTAGSRTVTASNLTHAAITFYTGTAATVGVGAFTQLQILAPGETAAPGTATGKTGSPAAQPALTPLNVTVNAVDANWNLISNAADNVGITSSDGNAILPSSANLVAGTNSFAIAFGSSGADTVTASDLSDGSKAAGISAAITVSKLNQSITFGAIPPQPFGTPVTLNAAASSGLTVGYSILSGPATVTGNTLTPTGLGPVIVQASQAGSSAYNAATSVSQGFTITNGTPSIIWTNPVDIAYGTPLSGTQLDASSTVPGAFSYTPPAGTVLNASNSQVLSVTLVPTDTTDYKNATTTVLINVSQAATTNALVSSGNPALPGASVSFTNTLAPSGSGAIPSGTVLFSTNGTAAGAAVTLTGGLATFSTALLSHGSNVITVAYAGDANYTGGTNSLTQVINTPPVAGTASFSRARDVGLLIDVSDLLTSATDADGDALTVTNVSATSTNSGTAGIVGGFIFYNPPALNGNVTDRFSYTVADSFGGTATGTVVVSVAADSGGQTLNIIGIHMTNGMSLISFAGIPGQSYYIQTVAILPPSNLWQTIGTNTAGTNGLFQFLDTDASNYPSRYYRTAVP